ncbi:hypothetical protein BDZ94DRAFT_1249682 [Collybia nuda]|uniref:Uncharacterized protein n=1 Tax=Collybia nuda TaxID=64659 RepID=A0A9P5YED9_9AGAR|nr:hypothetical protein BDZ94DRAFT_1249682 [Collybia nuda]
MPIFRARSDIAPLSPLHRQGSMPRLRDPQPPARSVEGQTTQSDDHLVPPARDLRRPTSSFNLGSGFEVIPTMNTRSKGIRPLPPIPTTTPPSYTEVCPHDYPTLRVIRPLPSPPTGPSRPDIIDLPRGPSSTQHQNVVATTISPKPVLSVELGPNAPAPSVRLVSPPTTRPALPLLITDTELLRVFPPPADPVSMVNSPATPQPPTPQTAKQKRITKLRRHLGERIPDEAVPIIQVTPQRKTEQGLERLQKLGVDSIYLRAAITVGKILNIPDDGGSDRSSVASEEDEAYEWDLVDSRECRSMSRRESRRWVREKGGRRWEESNYENVLQALRAL